MFRLLIPPIIEYFLLISENFFMLKSFKHGELENLSKDFTRSEEKIELRCQFSFAFLVSCAFVIYLL